MSASIPRRRDFPRIRIVVALIPLNIDSKGRKDLYTGFQSGRAPKAIFSTVTKPSKAHAAKSVHWVTGVAAFIFPADVGDQRLGSLHFNFEGGNQRIFSVHHNVTRLSLDLKADSKLHLRSPALACFALVSAVTGSPRSRSSTSCSPRPKRSAIRADSVSDGRNI